VKYTISTIHTKGDLLPGREENKTYEILVLGAMLILQFLDKIRLRMNEDRAKLLNGMKSCRRYDAK
jgi:hypothetical protein